MGMWNQFRSLLAGVMLAGIPGSVAAQNVASADPEIHVTATYSSPVLIFKVGEVTVTADIDADGYSATTHIRAAGLAALFTDFDIRADMAVFDRSQALGLA